jgi:hypothetical protein
MARFLLLRKLFVNLEAVAVVRPIRSDMAAVVTAQGHVEYVEGDDAVDLVAYFIAQSDTDPNRIEPDGLAMEIARGWLRVASRIRAFKTDEDADDE